VVGQNIGREVPAERHAFALSAVWEQKPVTVLALEVTWPEVSGLEPFHYDPWTTAARWEQAIIDKVQGFGGLLLQSSAGLFLWVFGLPQALEQLPQRAVHKSSSRFKVYWASNERRPALWARDGSPISRPALRRSWM